MPFYTHVVFYPDASTEKVGILPREFPPTTTIQGHTGLAPADDEAIEVPAGNDNLLPETSAGSYLIVKEAVRRLGASKIIFGSQFPLYHTQVELEKICVLLKGKDFERVTSKNILAMLTS